MKTFDKKQSIALSIVVFALGFGAGSFIFFVAYYTQLHNMKVTKAIMQSIDAYKFESYLVSLTFQVKTEIAILAWISFGIGIIISLIVPILALIKMNEKDKNIFGDAKFASLADIRKSKNFTIDGDPKEGIIVGKFQNKIIRYVGAAFSAMGAGTRAGKGAGIVIPNLLKYDSSVIILDPKRECFNITSLVRQKILKQQVYKFDPFSPNSHRYNPLHYIELGTSQGFNQLENLALIIFPYAEGASDAGNYLNKTAGGFFKALIATMYYKIQKDPKSLKLLDIEPILTLSKINQLYERADCIDLYNFMTEIREQATGYDKSLIDIGIAGLKAYNEMEDKTKAQMKSTFGNGLSPFANPNVAKATDGNDFDLRQVRKEKITIYYCVSGDNARLAEKITNIFFQQALQVNLEKMPTDDPEIKHDCLFLLDEFPSVGAVDYIKSKSGLIAGYRLKLLIVYQVNSQLDEIYGQNGAKTLLASAPCKIIYSASDTRDARELSEAMGTVTTSLTSKSKSRSKGGLSRSESESLIERPLITTNELLTLDFEEEILFMKGENPIRGEKAFYFKDLYFFKDFMEVSEDLKTVFKEGSKYKMPDPKYFESQIVAAGKLKIEVADLC